MRWHPLSNGVQHLYVLIVAAWLRSAAGSSDMSQSSELDGQTIALKVAVTGDNDFDYFVLSVLATAAGND
eukprot:6268036-Amphidinium_carterae.1